ncbi:MAG TPA: alpha/beta hydrolase [Steroidobacteraceae bacterium]|nr:alpha/beta hydrolase [Steroidobacteraceae bacterium]
MPKINPRHLVVYALLLVVVVGAVVVNQRYRHDLQVAHERISVGIIAQTKCGPIEYASVGSGAPVLVVHGAGGGFDQGLDFGAPLAKRGFRVVAMSRFGYLRTPLPNDASPSAQADAHVCLMDALGLQRTAIIGASAGAPSALQFAIRHPDRCTALVLMVPAGYVPRADGAPSLKTPPGTDFLFDSALKSDFFFWVGPKFIRKTFIEAILATPPEVVRTASTEEQARIDTVIEHILPVTARRLGLQNDAVVTKSLPRYDLESIRVPTLAISMADDLYGTYDVARYAVEHIPDARFVGYESSGHLWVGHQQEILDQVTQFLR